MGPPGTSASMPPISEIAKWAHRPNPGRPATLYRAISRTQRPSSPTRPPDAGGRDRKRVGFPRMQPARISARPTPRPVDGEHPEGYQDREPYCRFERIECRGQEWDHEEESRQRNG